MRSYLMFSLAAIATLGGCTHSTRPSDNASFDLRAWSDDLGTSGRTDDAATDGCSERAKLIYVIDKNGMFSSFDPRTLQFVDIGKVQLCGVQEDGSPLGDAPFDMAIDRNAVAWVNSASGRVYRVDTKTLACQDTGFRGASPDFWAFSLGFSADDVGSVAETLFIGGPSGSDIKLASLDTTTMKPSIIGVLPSLPSIPSLSGTGDAKLYGFFPDGFAPMVAQIDKKTGALGMTYPLPELAGSSPLNWAFAVWGGDFWIFSDTGLSSSSDAGVSSSSSHVWHVSISDRGINVSDAVPNTGRKIRGAAVSTCAPVIIF